jgi:guanosine-3',5'-bis(diphosphate) 3'-pyrophosphohydrolase
MYYEKQNEVTIDTVINRLRQYNPDADTGLIMRGYGFAKELHTGQKRMSGEDYINHPLATAMLLTELEMDDTSIAAALLHDIIEDAQVEFDQLAKLFNKEIAQLVDGVTKLKLADFAPREPETDGEGRKKKRAETDRSAENLRKIFLAMAKDFRVMVIKLDDRLHNMRTLSSLSPERQQRVATETLQIFAPLAHRLGIWQIKWELEDLAFKHLNPKEYEEIADRVAQNPPR